MSRIPPIKSNLSSSLKNKINIDDVSLKDIMSSFKSIHSEIQSVKLKLLIQKNMSSVILGKLESLSFDISLLKKKNFDLKKEIEILRSRCCNHTVTSALDQPNLDIVLELKERESKCRSIIIFNINEQADDKHFINNIFSNLNLDFAFKSMSLGQTIQ
jgi:hypothetical protein